MAAPTVTGTAIGQQPTRVRYWVIVFSVTLAIITYIDRVCISQAAPLMMKDLGLTKVEMGWAFTAFAVAYAIFEIPGGFLGDWMGPRRVLTRIVVWWSIFTALTGWVKSVWSLVVVRFLFGAGEAGCFPNVTKAFTTWLPQRERVRAQGIMWWSARWGGAFTPMLVYAVLQVMDWRRSFELFGAIGIVWAVWFFLWFRDNPRDKKSMNVAEREVLRESADLVTSHVHVPWGLFLRSRSVWLLCMQYWCLSYGWYFYITWLPTYLKEARGLDMGQSAVLAGMPLFLGGLGSLFGGFFQGLLAQRLRSVARARRVSAYLGFTGATLLLIVSTNLQNPLYAMIAMAFASFSNDLVMPGSWGACMDVGGKYAGTLSGAMNMMGNLGGALSPIAIGYILAATNSNWTITFYVSAAVYFTGAFLWIFLDPVTPLERAAGRAER
jgi:MFS family permease